MFENPDRDIYYANLPMIKTITYHWADDHPKRKQASVILALALMLAGVVLVAGYQINKGNYGTNQYKLHIAIWIAAAIAYAATRYRNHVTRPPFKKIINARFEMSDDGLYYIYQEGFKVSTYFIKDKDIEEWIYDKDYHVMYIKGQATIQTDKRREKGVPHPVSEMYCMCPFDIYEVDDIAEPYGGLLKYVDGELRMKHVEFAEKAGVQPYLASAGASAGKGGTDGSAKKSGHMESGSKPKKLGKK